jgi:hypothetical protein
MFDAVADHPAPGVRARDLLDRAFEGIERADRILVAETSQRAIVVSSLW